MSNPPTLAGLLESFFQHWLVQQRNASVMTLVSYRESLRLLVLYASERTGRQPCQLGVRDLGRELILDFLEHLEKRRGNGTRTRNARLTAIRSFFRHVAACDPASLGVAQRILDIPCKRCAMKAPHYLTASQLSVFLNAQDRQTPIGRRDYTFLLFLARTGARVSEAIGVDAADVHLDHPQQVLLRGKGRKQRLIPLSSDLAKTIEGLCIECGLGRHERRPIFIGSRGGRLTRFGATHIVRRAVRRALVQTPNLAQAKVSPHLFRHSLAMRLLQSGSDLLTIQAWLGHANVATTHRYAEADTEMMRRSLELAGVDPHRPAQRFKPKDSVLRILENI